MNHDYDKDTGEFTPKGGPTPDGGNPNQDSFKSKHPTPPPGLLGTGAARGAGEKLSGRENQINKAVEDAGG